MIAGVSGDETEKNTSTTNIGEDGSAATTVINEAVSNIKPNESSDTTTTDKASSQTEITINNAPVEADPATAALTAIAADSFAAKLIPSNALASNGPEFEPMAQYLVATALYQEVAMLKAYARDVGFTSDYQPYITRIAITSEPSQRGMPYDTYVDLNFSIGDGRTKPIQVMPLLGTDALEASLRAGATVDQAQAALNLAAGFKQIGFDVGLESIRELYKAVAGQDYNSVLNVTRIPGSSPSTNDKLRIRLGAPYSATAEYGVVNRTQFVTVVLLLPANSVLASGESELKVSSTVTYRNARNGIQLSQKRGKRGSWFAESAPDTVGDHSDQSLLVPAPARPSLRNDDLLLTMLDDGEKCVVRVPGEQLGAVMDASAVLRAVPIADKLDESNAVILPALSVVRDTNRSIMATFTSLSAMKLRPASTNPLTVTLTSRTPDGRVDSNAISTIDDLKEALVEIVSKVNAREEMTSRSIVLDPYTLLGDYLIRVAFLADESNRPQIVIDFVNAVAKAEIENHDVRSFFASLNEIETLDGIFDPSIDFSDPSMRAEVNASLQEAMSAISNNVGLMDAEIQRFADSIEAGADPEQFIDDRNAIVKEREKLIAKRTDAGLLATLLKTDTIDLGARLDGIDKPYSFGLRVINLVGDKKPTNKPAEVLSLKVEGVNRLSDGTFEATLKATYTLQPIPLPDKMNLVIQGAQGITVTRDGAAVNNPSQLPKNAIGFTVDGTSRLDKSTFVLKGSPLNRGGTAESKEVTVIFAGNSASPKAAVTIKLPKTPS